MVHPTDRVGTLEKVGVTLKQSEKSVLHSRCLHIEKHEKKIKTYIFKTFVSICEKFFDKHHYRPYT